MHDGSIVAGEVEASGDAVRPEQVDAEAVAGW